jgi:hypothetical protein
MKRSKSAIVGVVMTILSITGTAYYTGSFQPVPYGHVEIREVRETGKNVLFVANFIKVKCTFDRLQVQGETLGVWQVIPWVSDDRGDRLAGKETLSISFKASPSEFDRIQIKTRHDCNGRKVDKIFAEGGLEYWLSIY